MTKFNMLVEKDEDGFYISEVVGLPGCHSQAKTLDELIERTKEAIELYLECEQPEFFSKFFGVQQIEI